MIPLSTDPIKSLKRWAAVIGLGLLLVVAGCSFLYVWGLQRKVERLEAAQTTAVADVAAAETHRVGTATVTKQREEAKDATQEVLDRNPTYRDGAVPSDVADRLRKRPDSE